MNCRECDDLLAGYAAGDLNEEQSAACIHHLDECASCRESMEMYACLVTAISESLMIIPTETESINLSKSLKDVKLSARVQPRLSWRQKLEHMVLAVMCIVSFTAVTMITWAIRSGQISISMITNPVVLLPVIIIMIFIVSFLPITITARRKPLNGATFKR